MDRADEPTQTSTKVDNPEPHAAALEALRSEVADAKRLLEFAIARGRVVTDKVVTAIKKAEVWLVLPQASALPPVDERTEFELAYHEMAQVMAPVTAASLKATSDLPEDGRKVFPWAFKRPVSEAGIWSRKLWAYTVVTAVVILFSENMTRILAEFFPADLETVGAGLDWQIMNSVLQSLEPFAYGALGALAHLLRVAHVFIYERTFDALRKPEYNNRILLGVVSGGAIKLFVSQVGGDDGTALELSGAAMAFIAGYNSDFLFSAIERVVAAVLPKVGLESLRREAPDRVALMTVERLMTRYATAAEPEKAMIERLVDRLTQRRISDKS